LESKPEPEEELEILNEKISQTEKEISLPVSRVKPDIALPLPGGPIQEGDRVHIRSLGKKGEVLSVAGEDVEIQLGNIRVRAQKADLEHAIIKDQIQAEKSPQSIVRTPKDTTSPGTELDLRGQQVDEAIMNLGYYLDKAIMAGLPWVRIIHGMGMGRLRSAVRQMLKTHPQVTNFEAGQENEGGDGVTIVSFQE
jgi:DNA mismatch repair protein MutS2